MKSENSPARKAGFAPSADSDYLERMTDRPKRPRDANQLAKFIVDVATGDPSPAVLEDGDRKASAVAGGKARADALTKEQRKEIARIAADARWKKG